MKLIRKWFIFLIKWHFEREFRHFNYPFTSIDSKLYELKIKDKDLYYDYLQDARKIIKSKLWDWEMTELKKLFYKELAINTNNEIGISGYRLSLLFIRKLERRFKYLHDLSYTEEISQRSNKSLNKIYEGKSKKNGN